MTGWVWRAGADEVVPADQATLPYVLPGVLLGESLFETLRVTDGRLFRLEQHLERLARSVARMGWQPVSRDLILEGLARVVRDARPAAGDLRVRITVFRRNSLDELETVVWAGPYTPPPAELYRRGVAAILSPYRVDEAAPWTTLKCGNRLPHQAARRLAEERGVWEGLLLNTRGYLADGAITNVFFVSDGRLRTPGGAMGALPGIAGATVQELAGEMGLTVAEGTYPPEELRRADEAFLTNALIGVLPLVRVDGEPIGGGVPGPVTEALVEGYARLRVREAAELAEYLR